MITIIDYGMGNLASVMNAVRRCGKDVQISSDPIKISNADKLILPGVGAFKDAYYEIGKRGLRKGIMKFIASGRTFLGICLGLQLLFTKSYEDGEHKGFNIIKGDVVPFSTGKGLKVPHMGWNGLAQSAQTKSGDCLLLHGVPDNSPMYFVHSYYVVPEDKSVIATTTEYGVSFCSMIHKDNIYAVQFHPEKSQAQGLRIIENFARL